MKSDVQIAQEARMKPIMEVAEALGIDGAYVEQYGKYKAKISLDLYKTLEDKPDGKLILVSAINPTAAGEGKTTTTVGLGQALGRLGKKSMIALREPSLGPVFGIKGGAAGGGYAQVVPMEDINLHFTGDIHAVSTAHNLLSAMLDNHLQQGNSLGIDPRRVVWKRVVDMNDRALRNIVIGLGGRTQGVPRQDGYMISVASEVMAILCLADGLMDLKKRLGKMVVAYTYDDQAVTADDLGATGAMTVLLKDALKPNLVQTLENTPAFVHGGPFANIAHGCNSISATKTALKLVDYVITEAGFGADLGAEKFLDIKCRYGNLTPDLVVLVATVRALKLHGGVDRKELEKENIQALETGAENLHKHIENIRKFGLEPVVAINRFPTDTDGELKALENSCKALGVDFALSEVWAKGGEGGIELAEKVLNAIGKGKSSFKVLYDVKLPVKEKIEIIAREIYGADGVEFSSNALKSIRKYEDMGADKLPVCTAKTQYSLSDNPRLLGRPRGFKISVSEVGLSAGAGFLVAYTGDIMTMPGLPKVPSAESIDIDENGKITGLF